jgi:archaellum component FlaC
MLDKHKTKLNITNNKDNAFIKEIEELLESIEIELSHKKLLTTLLNKYREQLRIARNKENAYIKEIEEFLESVEIELSRMKL